MISLLTSYTINWLKSFWVLWIEASEIFKAAFFWRSPGLVAIDVLGYLPVLSCKACLFNIHLIHVTDFFLSIEINFNSQAFFLFIIFYALEEISWLKTLSKSWEFPDHKISLLISLKALLFVFIKSLCLKMGISMK